MRILHLLYEPRASGISHHVLEQIRLAPDLEHSVAYPEHLLDLGPALEAAGARAYPQRLRSRFLPRAALTRLPSLIRRVNPDVVHLHSLEVGVFGSVAARLAGARGVVFSPQTLDIRKRWLLPVYWQLMRRVGRQHALWITVAESHALRLRGLAPPGVRVMCLPNSVPTLRDLPARAEARARLGWPAEGIAVATLIRLSVQKDPLTFVRAARRTPGVFHAIAGEGPLRAQVEAAARGLTNLRVHGHVQAVRDVYAAADVIVLASRWEGMSLVLLTSLAYGRAVVATRIEGNTDLVSDERTGLLIAPGDDAGLATAVARLAADPALRGRLGAAGRALVEREHAPPQAAERLHAAYRSVAARVAHPPLPDYGSRPGEVPERSNGPVSKTGEG
jgi:glycosyltransferase involved in cell wall biosynthesis